MTRFTFLAVRSSAVLNFVVVVFRCDHVYTFLLCMFLGMNIWTVDVQLSTPVDAARQFSKVVVSMCVSSGTVCESWLLHSLTLNAILSHPSFTPILSLFPPKLSHICSLSPLALPCCRHHDLVLSIPGIRPSVLSLHAALIFLLFCPQNFNRS